MAKKTDRHVSNDGKIRPLKNYLRILGLMKNDQENRPHDFPEPLPNSRLGVFYATTVDSGFYEKGFSSEGLGIAPDVIIPLPIARKLTDNIDEWVLWVAEDLRRLPGKNLLNQHHYVYPIISP